MGRGRRRLHGEERTEYFPELREVAPGEPLPPRRPASTAASRTRDILRAGGLSTRNRPDLLVGGPPCIAFSKSGFWLDWKRDGVDPAASLLQAYTRVLAEAKPRYFILENVYALTFNNKASKPAFERLLREIDEAGYQFTWQVLNAADYGVPQARPRLFIVGCREGDTLPELPRADRTTASGNDARPTGGPLPHVTTGEALAGLITEPEPEEVVRGRWGHLLPEIPPGENYLHYTAERGHPDPLFEWRSRYWSFLLKLDPGPPVADHPGAARPERRTVPLGEPPTSRARASSDCSPSPTTTTSSASGPRCRPRSATPCRRCSPSGWLAEIAALA